MRDGSFTTSNPAINRLDVKQRLALKTEWGNTMEYEVKINIPAGTKINIGIAEKQISKIDGELCGGGDQILMAKDWPVDEWIVGERELLK